MRADGCNRRINYLLLQYKIVGDKENKDAEARIGATTGCIAESLQWHNAFEWRIKKIHYGKDGGFKPFVYPKHNKKAPLYKRGQLWELTGSNRRPSACKADALNQLS